MNQPATTIAAIFFGLCLQLPQTVLADLTDSDSDLVYLPVDPCRLFDTRVMGGAISAKQSRNFFVHGNSAAMTGQGGEPSGCFAPQGEPVAAHINLTVVASQGGFVTAHPKGSPLPLASNVNFGAGSVVANAFTVKTLFNVADRDITIFASAMTHVLADVQGYYYPARLGRKIGGVRYSEDAGGEIRIGLSDTIIDTIELMAPAAGHVIVNASSFVETLPAIQTVCGISMDSNFRNSFETGLFVVGAGNQQHNIVATKGFQVTEGLHFFNLICARGNGSGALSDDTRSLNSNMTAIYSPNLLDLVFVPF
jgi:hypothetical protein